jgi:hypothetical protein
MSKDASRALLIAAAICMVFFIGHFQASGRFAAAPTDMEGEAPGPQFMNFSHWPTARAERARQLHREFCAELVRVDLWAGYQNSDGPVSCEDYQAGFLGDVCDAAGRSLSSDGDCIAELRQDLYNWLHSEINISAVTEARANISPANQILHTTRENQGQLQNFFSPSNLQHNTIRNIASYIGFSEFCAAHGVDFRPLARLMRNGLLNFHLLVGNPLREEFNQWDRYGQRAIIFNSLQERPVNVTELSVDMRTFCGRAQQYLTTLSQMK